MQNLLLPLESPDFHFLLGVTKSPISFTNDARLKSLLADYEADPTLEKKKALHGATRKRHPVPGKFRPDVCFPKSAR